jgi:hypothetical protein
LRSRRKIVQLERVSPPTRKSEGYLVVVWFAWRRRFRQWRDRFTAGTGLSIFFAFVNGGAGSSTSTKKLHRFANHFQF